jgi:hypothetical protein
MKRNWSADERRRFAEQTAEWARQRQEFELVFARWQARVQAARDRRDRRRRLLGRVLRLRRI